MSCSRAAQSHGCAHGNAGPAPEQENGIQHLCALQPCQGQQLMPWSGSDPQLCQHFSQVLHTSACHAVAACACPGRTAFANQLETSTA